ncbi:MAG: hypothetical protein Kow0069_33370 [Promethearchaeota archaeon]
MPWTVSGLAPQKAEIGAWIIVAGDRSDHELLSLIRYGAERVYNILKYLGYSDDDIYYLDPADTDGGGPDAVSPHRDGSTTWANVQSAITTWAAGKVNSTEGLGMYLFDHGGVNYMCIPGSPELSASNLNDWLDQLELVTGCNRVVIVYEACHAGSFIDEVSSSDRLIITSTNVVEGASVNPAGTWATFSELFWGGVETGDTLGVAFERATKFLRDNNYGQYPWVDDDHDGVGHETDAYNNLPNGGDGWDAIHTVIDNREEEDYLFLPPLIFEQVPWPIWWPDGSVAAVPVWAKLPAASSVTRVFVRVAPAGYAPSLPQVYQQQDGDSLFQDSPDLVQVVELSDPDCDGNFTGEINPSTRYGGYRLNFWGQDDDGRTSEYADTTLNFSTDGNPPPDDTPPEVQITLPYDGAVLNYSIISSVDLTAEADDDQGLASVKLFWDGKLVASQDDPHPPYQELVHTLSLSQQETGEHNVTAIATDLAGNVAQDSISVEVVGTNPLPSWARVALPVGIIAVVVVVVVALLRRKK